MFHELHFYALKILRFKALKKSGVHFDAVNTKSASQLDPIKQRHGLGDAQLIHVTFGKRAQLRHKRDRKSTRLNSSHGYISYAVFCLKKKKSIKDLDMGH